MDMGMGKVGTVVGVGSRSGSESGMIQRRAIKSGEVISSKYVSSGKSNLGTFWENTVTDIQPPCSEEAE
eukprot:77905-Hanusia_phi.AAC.1